MDTISDSEESNAHADNSHDSADESASKKARILQPLQNLADREVPTRTTAVVSSSTSSLGKRKAEAIMKRVNREEAILASEKHWYTMTLECLGTPVSIQLEKKNGFYVLEENITFELTFLKALTSPYKSERMAITGLFFERPTCFSSVEFLTKSPILRLISQEVTADPSYNGVAKTFTQIVTLFDLTSRPNPPKQSIRDIFLDLQKGHKNLLAYLALLLFDDLDGETQKVSKKELKYQKMISWELRRILRVMQSSDSNVAAAARREFRQNLELASIPMIISATYKIEPLLCSLFRNTMRNRFDKNVFNNDFESITKKTFEECLVAAKDPELSYSVVSLYKRDQSHSITKASPSFLRTSAFQNALTAKCPRALYHHAITQDILDPDAINNLRLALRHNLGSAYVPLNRAQSLDATTRLGMHYFKTTQQFDQALLFLTYARNHILEALAMGRREIDFDPTIDSMIFALYNEGLETGSYPIAPRGDEDISLDKLFIENGIDDGEMLDPLVNELNRSKLTIYDEARVYILREVRDRRAEAISRALRTPTISNDDDDNAYVMNPPPLFTNEENQRTSLECDDDL